MGAIAAALFFGGLGIVLLGHWLEAFLPRTGALVCFAGGFSMLGGLYFSPARDFVLEAVD